MRQRQGPQTPNTTQLTRATTGTQGPAPETTSHLLCYSDPRSLLQVRKPSHLQASSFLKSPAWTTHVSGVLFLPLLITKMLTQCFSVLGKRAKVLGRQGCNSGGLRSETALHGYGATGLHQVHRGHAKGPAEQESQRDEDVSGENSGKWATVMGAGLGQAGLGTQRGLRSVKSENQ